MAGPSGRYPVPDIGLPIIQQYFMCRACGSRTFRGLIIKQGRQALRLAKLGPDQYLAADIPLKLKIFLGVDITFLVNGNIFSK